MNDDEDYEKCLICGRIMLKLYNIYDDKWSFAVHTNLYEISKGYRPVNYGTWGEDCYL